MANLTANTKVAAGALLGGSAKAFYTYSGLQTSGAVYIHIKTNIPTRTSAMFMVEADGYAYGMSANVRCSWTGYTYSESAVILSSTSATQYNGMSANGVYYSADGFVVLRAYCQEGYMLGFTLNSFNTAPSYSPGFNINVTAASANTNSGNFY